jgi:tetratricopeptide (TPR) repeat protein
MKTVYIIIFLAFYLTSFSKTTSDSLKIRELEEKFEINQNQLSEVRRDQLNYKIEKDLLKETYENNYQKISMFITVILGIIGVAGFIGIRDINSIKKEYVTELANLKQLQTDLSSKFKEFETSKEKYDGELRDVIRTNDDQNKKIKILELKEKIQSLFGEKKYVQALEFCVVALELNPIDISLLQQKARLYTRTRNYNESIITYKRILELDINHNASIMDLAEVYLFNKQRLDFDKIIEANRELFENKCNGKLIQLFAIIKAFQDENLDELKSLAAAQIDTLDLESKKNKIDGWDLWDAQIYAVSQEDSEAKSILQNTIWYVDGQIDGNLFYSRTQINNPNFPVSS